MLNKAIQLLHFLKDAAAIRRRRIPKYTSSDQVLWLSEVPEKRRECRSPFLAVELSETPEYWLEVHKPSLPAKPQVPAEIRDWLRPEDPDFTSAGPELLPEITILVEKEVPDLEASEHENATIVIKEPKLRKLVDYPKVEELWLEYLVNKWEPWAKEMIRWQEVHKIYEKADKMRRQLEEAEEQYELFLGVGLIQWWDSKGTEIKRHLLTGKAEIEFDAARGIISILPAASFDNLQIELDMLEIEDQPRLKKKSIEEKLEELDIQAWDRDKVKEVLQEIANLTRSGSVVDCHDLAASSTIDEKIRITFAPAIVLRQRRPTSFEEILKKFSTQMEQENNNNSTSPWENFVKEGNPNNTVLISTYKTPSSESTPIEPPSRIFFPLPTNDEQKQIIERLQRSSCVVVKGPPGTGKSHTIVNLMCHLLATGERVLVTAQAPKALTVLRDMLPKDLQDLCVTALGASREDQQLLEDGVRGILRRQNNRNGYQNTTNKINDVEKELQQLEKDLSIAERKLRESREAETYTHTLQTGYKGTAAQIAKRLEKEQELYGWFPEILHDQPEFPLTNDHLNLFVEVNVGLSKELESELSQDIGDYLNLNPDDFKSIVNNINIEEKEAEEKKNTADPCKLSRLYSFDQETLERTVSSLKFLWEQTSKSSRILGDLTGEILKDLLCGQDESWKRLLAETGNLQKQIDDLISKIGNTRIHYPKENDRDTLLADSERRLEHLKKGGGRGFLFFKSRLIKETAYLEQQCSVSGRKVKEPDQLEKLVAFLKLLNLLNDFKKAWPGSPNINNSEPVQAAARSKELLNETQEILTFFDEQANELFKVIPREDQIELNNQAEQAKWIKVIDAELSKRRLMTTKQPLEDSLKMLNKSLESHEAHNILHDFKIAIEKRDPLIWEEAWRKRSKLYKKQKLLKEYKDFLTKIGDVSKDLENVLRDNQGNAEWKERIQELDKAWAWAATKGWIQDVLDKDRYSDLVRKTDQLHSKIEDKLGEMVSLLAWDNFFKKLSGDEITVQNLKAWTKAVGRVGRGTGKYAYKHRRTARNYLMDCIPKIPAWIMPLHKLWDSVDAEPGLFDTVIIDEASQAGIDSIVLFLLAKRIIIVGDDKQNSPEGVGIRENDITRLSRQYLQEFRFRDEFRLDASLFDHAERIFHNLISLREHFRCVPELISFSNHLCYTDAPLIPLRQAPPDHIPPLRTSFVEGGCCEGKGQRIINSTEAEKIVKTIKQCVDDDNYDGKSMGVIVLQGHSQADLIASRLAKELVPNIIKERKLRCGVPATFQGDQRDVIFLSLVTSPEIRSRALTQAPDKRRFNVAMSRAKDQAWLFHSVQTHDLNPKCIRRKLLDFFQKPKTEKVNDLNQERERLERALRDIPRELGSQPEPYDSWFEVDVAIELLRRHYRIRPQYEIIGKYIDIVIEGSDTRLAVECDGDFWHGPEKYDEDMARERKLRRAGLTFARVRESEFYADRKQAIKEIIKACDDLDITPVELYGEFSDTEQKDTSLEGKSQETIEVNSKTENHEESEEDEKEESISGEGPFSGYTEKRDFPDPRQASTTNIRSILRRIIEKEGPISRASIYRLYVAGCPHIQRVGRAVRQALNIAIGAMLRTSEITQEDELGNKSPEGLIIRITNTPKVRERTAGQRSLNEIPPSELSVIIDRYLSDIDGAIQEEEIFRKILNHYDFSKLTTVRRKYLNLVFNLYKKTK